MVEYKGFQISSELNRVIKYMDGVQNSQERLIDLSRNWDSLSLLSQLGEAGVNMSEIKNNFTHLSSTLINHLGDETLKKTLSEMHSKAQVAVDIVIRNLFERTADIGFLATDEEIRSFLIEHHTKYEAGYQKSVEPIVERFKEYVTKYSVYSDIILMNKNGDILANIDETNNATKSHDKVINEAVNTHDEYVESFKYHDFLPSQEKSLVYSYRITENSSPNSPVIGVLALCFKFEDEMQGVFENLANKDTKESITLLDQEGYVIASSDIYHVPVGAKLEKILDKEYEIVTFGGRDYLAKSCATNGYQGFYGLGWYGHIMVPLDYAFSESSKKGYQVSKELLLAILQHGDQFPQALKNIPIQASSIQNNLNLAIWNGNVKQSSSSQNKQFSRALLQEIRKTGENTKSIIGSSIASLTKTMVLGDSVFLADLIVDIMDRNLYERANDCRWWALTPDFRELLAQEVISYEDKAKISSILKYINDLYTVYTNLFIYDKHGVIIAVSNPQENHLVGTRLSTEWVSNTLKLSDSSKYCVSGFDKTSLYGQRHTYIYNAAICSEEQSVLGGIGVVFDSELQFKTMIEESLPKQNGNKVKDGVFAVLATKEKMIISSNEDSHVTGEFLSLDSKFFQLNSGESMSEIIEYHGNYYAVGVKCSSGYREFKSQKDDYVNNVYSFLFSYISNVEETVIEQEDQMKRESVSVIDRNSVDIATFMIGSQYLGVKSDDVLEAKSVEELKSIAKIDADHYFMGTVIYDEKVVSVIDIGCFLKEENIPEYSSVVILKGRTQRDYIGILVNSLGDIPSIPTDKIHPLQDYIVGDGTLVQGVVFPPDRKSAKDVLSILSVERIYYELVKPKQTYLIEKKDEDKYVYA